MNTLSDMIKTTLLCLIFLQIAPPLWRSVKDHYLGFLSQQTRVGRVIISGPIEDSSEYAKPLKAFFKDPSIKAILLHIESTQGNPGASQSLFKEIQTLKKRFPKPIIAFTEKTCTSGAFYCAAATDYIIASPSALVGDIHAHYDISSSKEVLSSLNNDASFQYAADIAKIRKLSFQRRDEWNTLVTGKKAHEKGLIDALGSYSTIVLKLKEIAPIEGSVRWVDVKEMSGIFRWILELMPRSFSEQRSNTQCHEHQQPVQSL